MRFKKCKKKRFGRFNKWVKNKIRVVYNGVDSTKLIPQKEIRHAVREKLGIDNQVLIGIIGNIIPIKGQDFFLKGIAKAKEYKPNLYVKILIIGRSIDHLYKQKIRQLVKDLDLIDDVIFMNYTEKIDEIFSALDIFVLSSKREGFSRSLLEAMSFGLPILATKIDEIEEAVISGKNAILMNFGDVENLASGIIKLYENKKLREKMGIKNCKRLSEKFNLQLHSEAVTNIYHELLHFQ